jgi:hypothetical protein
MKSTLNQWKKARNYFKGVIKAELAMVDASKHHRSENPLKEEMVDAIIAAFVQGKPLCCETSLKTLDEIGLDPCWSAYINDWAYNHIGCGKSYKPGGSLYEKALKKLSDKLKGGV